MNGVDDLDAMKRDACAVFAALQNSLISAFEGMEDGASGPFDDSAVVPGRFTRMPWARADPSGEPGGGGTMAILKGRVFEKAGIESSVVFGTFAPEFRGQIPGTEADPRFWAAGVSLIAHPWNLHVPTVHMNIRMVVTSRVWFGGGADLTPMLDRRRTQADPDTVAFHAAMRRACTGHRQADYDRYKAWCDDYFLIRHRNEPRGVGGIFFDNLWSGDGAADLSFTRSVGEALLSVYPDIVRGNLATPWTSADREAQQVRRGRYVEFNLVYDRGTIFGLKTGGNIDAILSSLPPTVRWP